MGIEFVAADGESQNGEVDRASAEAIEQNGCDLFGDGEMDLGKFARECGEARREPIGSDGGNGADNDGAGFGLQTFGEFVLGAGEFVENGASTREESAAEVGQSDGAAEAIEEAAAEFEFELLDLLGERGLRDVAFFGGSREGAGVGDGAEVTELVKFHERANSQQLLASR